MHDVVIISAVCSPAGKRNELGQAHPADLPSAVVSGRVSGPGLEIRFRFPRPGVGRLSIIDWTANRGVVEPVMRTNRPSLAKVI